MPIIVQRDRPRMAEVGIIRIGKKIQGTTAAGKVYERPSSLEQFRFTTPHIHAAEKVAEVYGGAITRFTSGRRPGYDVETSASTIKAVISLKRVTNGQYESLSEDMELWQGGTNIRRCDGVSCIIWDKGKNGIERMTRPCICKFGTDVYAAKKKAIQIDPKEEKVCALKTRTLVLLPELENLGLWRLNSESVVYNQQARAFFDNLFSMGFEGQLVPITMTIVMKEKQTAPGEKTSKFPVVELLVDPNPIPLASIVNKVANAAMGNLLAPGAGMNTPVNGSTMLELDSTVEIIDLVEEDDVFQWAENSFGRENFLKLMCFESNVDLLGIFKIARDRNADYTQVQVAVQRAIAHNAGHAND
jgi:hypothetical protein